MDSFPKKKNKPKKRETTTTDVETKPSIPNTIFTQNLIDSSCPFTCKLAANTIAKKMDSIPKKKKNSKKKKTTTDETKPSIPNTISTHNLIDSSCPFTWKLADKMPFEFYDRGARYGKEIVVKEIINLLIECYGLEPAVLNGSQKYPDLYYGLVSNNQIHKAKYKLIQSQEYYLHVCESRYIVEIKRGVRHVIDATECYLYKDHDETQFEESLKTLVPITSLNKKERGAVYGLEGIAWSSFRNLGTQKTLEALRKAIKLDGNNPIWYFLQGINLRSQRYERNKYSPPYSEERICFTKAYEITKNSDFAIHYAQMLRELLHERNLLPKTAERRKAEIVEEYKILYNSCPTESVLLKITLGLIRLKIWKEMIFAKRCLDKVALMSPEDSTYLRYRGIYYEYIQKNKEAIKCFKEAADRENYIAEISYVDHAYKLKQMENPTEYLQDKLEKYKSNQKALQMIYLGLATSCYMVDHTIINAAEYYLKAIKINPKDRNLTDYYSFLEFNTDIIGSVYQFIERTILPQIEKLRSTKELYNSIERFCRDHETPKK